MSDTPKTRRAWLWPVVVLGCGGAVAGAALWVVLREPNLRDELASGDADRMRAALTAADTDSLKGADGLETSTLAVEAMKTMSMEELVGLWENDELSDEERDKLQANMGAVWMNYMGGLADRFFAASPEEKEQILDQSLDEFMEFAKRKEEYDQAHKDDPERQKREEENRERWKNPSREDRKNRMMNVDPDRQMKMANMWMRMSQRAKERGLDLGKGKRDRDDDKEDDSDKRRSRKRDAD